MLLDAIDELGIRDNTVFIFTADNGPEALPEETNSVSIETAYPGSAGPWRGTLFTGFEGALLVPFVVRWPGHVPPGTVSDGIVHEMDLFPTLARIAGGEVPGDRPIDGVDQTDLFLGRQEELSSSSQGVDEKTAIQALALLGPAEGSLEFVVARGVHPPKRRRWLTNVSFWTSSPQ